jgi:acyl-CoA synthetase
VFGRMAPPHWSLRPISADDAERYTAEGWWTGETLGTRLWRGLARNPDLDFVIHSSTRPWAGSFGDVFDLARRVAGGLIGLGVEPGDVVSFQSPNWMETAVAFYAAAFAGAVVVPIVHFYGAKEVGYILGSSAPRVHITAASFGHQDFVANLGTLDVAGTSVVVLDTPAWSSLASAAPLDAPVEVDVFGPALIGWTSGTTANPKGVIHSHQTVAAEVKQLGEAMPPFPRPNLVGAPVSHAIGMLSALLVPVDRGEAIHLIDVWDPGVVLSTMAEYDLGPGGGATFFFTSLIDHPSFGDEHLSRIEYAGMGGSAVPVAVTERLTSMGINVYRMYGSTEHPSITGCTYQDPIEKRLVSDGPVLPGSAIRLVDEHGALVGPGEPGEILSRGPDCFVGYTDPALTATVFDADGWYHTGDVAVMDSDGYLAITDRKNDVIIRGGENISAAEVEELLLRIPGVAEAAVVAAPDARLGERAAAFVRMLPGCALPSLADVRTALEAAGLARQKWPEELIEAAELPRTASGKVQKFVLRDQLRAR